MLKKWWKKFFFLPLTLCFNLNDLASCLKENLNVFNVVGFSSVTASCAQLCREFNTQSILLLLICSSSCRNKFEENEYFLLAIGTFLILGVDKYSFLGFKIFEQNGLLKIWAFLKHFIEKILAKRGRV